MSKYINCAPGVENILLIINMFKFIKIQVFFLNLQLNKYIEFVLFCIYVCSIIQINVSVSQSEYTLVTKLSKVKIILEDMI